MDEKHTGETKDSEMKKELPPSTYSSLSDYYEANYYKNLALATQLKKRHQMAEQHLCTFAHAPMADATLTRSDALKVWLKGRSRQLGVAFEGRYAVSELMFLTLCINQVAQLPSSKRQYMQPLNILSVFKEVCVMGRAMAVGCVSSDSVERVFGRVAALFGSVMNSRNNDELLEDVGADFAEEDETKDGKYEKKADSRIADSMAAQTVVNQKRTMDLAAQTVAANASGSKEFVDAETRQLQQETEAKMEASPLDNKARAVLGMLLYSSRVFWHIWAKQLISSMFGDLVEVAVADGDRVKFDSHMQMLCELEPAEDATIAVVALYLRQNTIVGAVDAYRRNASSEAQPQPSSLIQMEISVNEYNKLNDEASAKPQVIWSDSKNAAREALCIESFARQLSFQDAKAATSAGGIGLKSTLFQRHCILHDELVDKKPILEIANTGQRPRLPIMVHLPCGWVVHHSRYRSSPESPPVSKYLKSRSGVCDFESAAIIWMRLVRSEFSDRLACGTSVRDLINRFLYS